MVCLNMQMRHYLSKYGTNLHTYPDHKSEFWIKPGSKFLFNLVDILESKVFTDLFLSLQKSEHTVIKTVIKISMFHKSGYE